MSATVCTGFRLFRALAVLLAVAALVALAVRAPDGPGPIVYHPSGMEKVTVRRDIVYTPEGTNKESLRYDVFLPDGHPPADGWPTVVLIHGGPVSKATKPKDWPAFDSFGRAVAASGMAAVTFNYRFPGSDHLASATVDVIALIEHVRRQAKQLHIDGQRLCLWAFSGGGPQLSFAVRDHPDYVRCMIAFYARLDAGAGQDRYSPVALVRAGPKTIAPLFIARAGKDSANINGSIDALAREAKARGLPVEVVNYAEGGHAFDIVQDTDESRRIITQAIAFAKTHLTAAVTIPQGAPRSAVVVAHVTVIDVIGGAAKADQTVVLRDARIAEVGPAKETRVPPDAKVIDGRGRFLIPGLWDMHVHVLWDPAVDTLLPLFIANGVTGVRDMHTHAPFEQVRRWHNEVEEGKRVGPRLVYAGPIVDGPKTIWPGSIAARDAESARKAVRDLKASGAAFVKVYERLPREAYFAIADEAKKQGIRFAGHIPEAITPVEASDAGQHSVEHLSHLLEHCSTGDGPNYDPVKGAALFETFKKNQTWQCPTLIVARTTTFGREDRFAKDPRRKYFTPFILSRVGFDDSKRDWNFTLRVWKEEQKLMRDMQQAGVELLAGTDTPIVRNVPGFTLHDELAALVEAGLTPLRALQAATSNPARFMGRLDSMGSIEKGKVADLVLLSADPLLDIANTTRIEAVVADGRLYDRAAVDKLLEAVEATAKQEQAADKKEP